MTQNQNTAENFDVIQFFQWLVLEIGSPKDTSKSAHVVLLICLLALAIWMCRKLKNIFVSRRQSISSTELFEDVATSSQVSVSNTTLSPKIASKDYSEEIILKKSIVLPQQTIDVSRKDDTYSQSVRERVEGQCFDKPSPNGDLNCASINNVVAADSSTKSHCVKSTEKLLKPKAPGRGRLTKVFDPAHYKRHSGIPGHLYLVRNKFHQIGLFKLGYTTLTPDERVNTLNAQHKNVSDVGTFELVHSVPISATFEGEKALFELIADARVATGREFFFESQDYLIRALNAVHHFDDDSSTAMSEFYEWTLERESWGKFRPNLAPSISLPPLPAESTGWIYAARNPWHRDNIFRVCFSTRSPRDAIERLNVTQRNLTCQIGFYVLVDYIDVAEVNIAWKYVHEKIAPHRVARRLSFFEIPLAELSSIFKAFQKTSCRPFIAPTDYKISSGQLRAEVVRGTPSAQWKNWTAPCPECLVRLRILGIIASNETLDCPACGAEIHCYQGPRGCTITRIPDNPEAAP